METIPKTNLGEVVQQLLSKVPPKSSRSSRAALVTLSGDLGAGKTTFVQELAKALGISEAVVSPTYVLMKKYVLTGQPFKQLVHIDAYRLAGAHEFEALDPASFLLDEDALVCIEWPERIEGALPTPDVELVLSAEGMGDHERGIHFK